MVRKIDKTWWDEWVEMPEFIQEDKKAIQTIKIHFETQEDIEEFSKLVGKKITPSTKGFFFPIRKKDSERFCVDEP